jgi:hypothetical protein
MPLHDAVHHGPVNGVVLQEPDDALAVLGPARPQRVAGLAEQAGVIL